jgi:hypothetical protein
VKSFAAYLFLLTRCTVPRFDVYNIEAHDDEAEAEAEGEEEKHESCAEIHKNGLVNMICQFFARTHRLATAIRHFATVLALDGFLSDDTDGK